MLIRTYKRGYSTESSTQTHMAHEINDIIQAERSPLSRSLFERQHKVNDTHNAFYFLAALMLLNLNFGRLVRDV